MVRTQIYLDDNLLNNLRTGAKLNKTTVSGYIRFLLSQQITITPPVKKQSTLLDLAKMGKRIKSGKRQVNISGNINKYLPEEWR